MSPKRKPNAQFPNPPKRRTAPTGLPPIDNVRTTTVAEVSPSQEPLGQVPSTTLSSFPTLSTVPDVVGMDDFSTPQVSAHGLATGASGKRLSA